MKMADEFDPHRVGMEMVDELDASPLIADGEAVNVRTLLGAAWVPDWDLMVMGGIHGVCAARLREATRVVTQWSR